MRDSNIQTQIPLMAAPVLYLQLLTQLRQWITPLDHRHLQVFCEAVAAILQAQSACLSHWLPFLTHRNCQARSHQERLSYFIHNPKITSDTFYSPLVRQFLQAWQGASVTLALDTSVLWDEFCLIEVCLLWGGRSIALGQEVLEHGSASVGFEQYRPVLEATQKLLPPGCQVLLLADRGFEHRELIRWLQQQGWSWRIRAKVDLNVTLASGKVEKVGNLIPPQEEAYCFHHVKILGDINCHLATAYLSKAKDSWAVLTDESPSLQTFAEYGERFGGIEPHFKDYKSGAFDLIRSHLRDAKALRSLLMLLASAQLIALSLALILTHQGLRRTLDWHSQRGLSFLQLGLREIKRLCYQGLLLPPLQALRPGNIPPGYASKRKRDFIESQIQFSRVTVFSA